VRPPRGVSPRCQRQKADEGATRRRSRLAGVGITLCLIAASPASSQDARPDKPPTPLFAVVFRTGPSWDATKPSNEQAFFMEHPANLRRLREALAGSDGL
jgi:hypothetical protein